MSVSPEPPSDSAETMVVACPVCRKRGPWLSGKSRPFCSERCRLLDLGNWFDTNYRISEPLRPDHFAQYEELEEAGDLDHPESSDGSI